MAKPIILAIVVVLITSIGAYMTINMRQGASQEELFAQAQEIIKSSNAKWAKVKITENNNIFVSGKTVDETAVKSLITDLSKIEGINTVTSSVVVSRPMTLEQCQQVVDSILESELQFDQSENSLLENSFPILETIADTVRLCPGTNLLIVSHTNNSNSAASNQEISSLRSANVMAHLIEKEGLTDRTIAAIGMGAAFPIVLNDSKINRDLNERVEIIIR